MARPWMGAVVWAGLALGACGGTLGCKLFEKKAPPPPPPPEVKVAAVLQRDLPVYVEAIGQTRGSTEVEVRSRVEGIVESVDFREGNPVKKGDLLYTIDPRPYEAALAQSKGKLAEAQAQQARARQDVVRYEPLVAKNAISRMEYETAVAVERAAVAATAAAAAAVESAQIDLGYTRVTAPEDGLAGRTEVYRGSLVGKGGSTLLTHLSQVDPIHVRFTIPEKDYLFYARRREARGATAETPSVPFELVLADGSVHPAKGTMVFTDRNVDPTTGTILMEAAFPNPARIVRPGQYARVRAAVDFKNGAILVPQRAVLETQGTYSVAVVKADSTIDLRMVTPSTRLGSLWVIDSGLTAGDKIVVEGLQKVRPGIKVNPQAVTIDEGNSSGASPAAAPAVAGK
ncbi:MAG: efflux RND transporter periplasmic adaptor subunit [Deltaproteobacteria bacterium]|nr:efflux RND transporter periplasmic adaptor subunit [Deltaproteobacteria bacterium]